MDSDKKIKDIASTLKPTEAFMITNLEELSYLFNIRDFSKNYSTKVEREPEIILSTGEHFKFTKENFRLIKEIKRNNNEYISGLYSVGRFAWILEDIEILDSPIEAKGQLGIWNY